MKMDNCFHLGTISRTHGRTGAVQVKLNIDAPHDIQNWGSVFLELNQKPVPFFIEEISGNLKKAIIKFEDIDTPEAGNKLKGTHIHIPLDLIDLADEENRPLEALAGFSILSAERQMIGKIISIEEYPSQSMATLLVQEQTILIPIHPDWIIDLNPEAKELTLDLPEGLIESQLD